MNLVEAIDAWIDECIDDLSDDELSRILDILDVVSASDFVDLDVDAVTDEDVVELTIQTGGTAADRAQTSSVLRAALFGELPASGSVMAPSPEASFLAEVEAAARPLFGPTLEPAETADDGFRLADDDGIDSGAGGDLNKIAPISLAEPTDRAVPSPDSWHVDDDKGGLGSEPLSLKWANDPDSDLRVDDERDLDNEEDELEDEELEDDDAGLELEDEDELADEELDDEELDDEELEDDDAGLEDEDELADEALDDHEDEHLDHEEELEDEDDEELDDEDEHLEDELDDEDEHLEDEDELDDEELEDEEDDEDDEEDEHLDDEDELADEDDVESEDSDDVEAGVESHIGFFQELQAAVERDEEIAEAVDTAFLSDLAAATSQPVVDRDRSFVSEIRSAGVANRGAQPAATSRTVIDEAALARARDNSFVAEIKTAASKTSALTATGLIQADPAARERTRQEIDTIDALGPSFLPDAVEPTPEPPGLTLRQILMLTFMAGAMGVFAVGMVQLVKSLDEPEPTSAEEVAVRGDDEQPESVDGAETAVNPSDESDPPAAGSESTSPAEEPTTSSAPGSTAVTATDEPTPRIGIRLVNGDVMLASSSGGGEPAAIKQIYDADPDVEGSAARDVTWLDTNRIGVLTVGGDIVIVNPDTLLPRPRVLYEASEDLPPAVQINRVLAQLAVRTDDGSLLLIPMEEAVEPDAVTTVWDASEEGAAIVDVDVVGDLVPFVLDNGNAQMVVTSRENAIVTIWLAGGQPRAFNLAESKAGVLLGVGEGAVARYRVGPVEGERLESVWDPFSRDQAPAISYGDAGEQTAIVLGTGAVLLIDEEQSEQIWDPFETELRALSADGDDRQVAVLLEAGSVVRIPRDEGSRIESVWDVTDETLSPALQIIVEQLDG